MRKADARDNKTEKAECLYKPNRLGRIYRSAEKLTGRPKIYKDICSYLLSISIALHELAPR